MTDSAADTDDLLRFADLSAELADAVAEAVGPWVHRSVAQHLGASATGELLPRIQQAAADAEREVVPVLRDLLALDIDQQWTNPLSLLRRAAVHPSAVLDEAGVPPATRDETARRLHPDDHHDLVPAAFADLGPRVHEAGIAWGAAKAHLHLRRRSRNGTPDERREPS